MAGCGRKGNGDTGEGGGSQLTRIFLFAVSLAVCTVDKAQMSESAAVVVSATLGGVQEI